MITITVFTDVRSPYAFLAKAEVYRWEDDFGAAVEWLPYEIPIREAFGAAEDRNARQLRKVKYLYRNARRVGAEQGLTICGTKRIFDPTPAHVGLLQARDDGIFRVFQDRVFEGVFRRELDPDDAAQVRAVFETLRGDADAYSRRLENGAAELHAIGQRAEALGVFGVPSFVIDGELFWGTDTQPQIRKRLEAEAGRTTPVRSGNGSREVPSEPGPPPDAGSGGRRSTTPVP